MIFNDMKLGRLITFPHYWYSKYTKTAWHRLIQPDPV